MTAAHPEPSDAHRQQMAEQHRREQERERAAVPDDPPSVVHLANAVTDHGIILETVEQDLDSRGKYRSRSIALAHIYRLTARHIDSFHDLEIELKRYRDVADILGFGSEVADSSAFSYWWREKYSDETQNAIEEIAETVRRSVLSLPRRELKGAVEPLVDEEPPEPTEITPGQKETAIQNIKPLMYDGLDFDRADNQTWEKHDFLDLQAEASREGSYLQRIIEDHYWDEGEGAPRPKSVSNAIQNKTADEWSDQFRQVYDRQINAAKGAGMLDRPCDVYIDGTVVPFYKQNAGLPDGATGGKEKNGTYYGFHHITISAHDKGRSILLASYELTEDDTLQEAVKYLIRQAEEYVNIGEVCMDSEFRKTEMLKWLDDRGHDFIIQYPKHGKRLKRKLALMDGTHDTADYTISSSSSHTSLDLTLVAEPDYGKIDSDFSFERNSVGGQMGLEDYGGGAGLESIDLEDVDSRLWEARRSYLTNKDVAADDAEAAISRYKKRWRIETKYRVIKNEFLATTKTRDFAMRTFYWLFACMLYNSWVLLDVFLRKDHPELAPEDRAVMAASAFARRFLKTEHG